MSKVDLTTLLRIDIAYLVGIWFTQRALASFGTETGQFFFFSFFFNA